eukprot:scaffold4094_cov65-Cyclotella_meneghiniana.AAC.2
MNSSAVVDSQRFEFEDRFKASWIDMRYLTLSRGVQVKITCTTQSRADWRSQKRRDSDGNQPSGINETSTLLSNKRLRFGDAKAST